MSTLADSLLEEITLQLSQASVEHGHAVVQRREKDTAANRALVDEWSMKIDSLLDMYLQAGPAGRQPC
jgi:hypothetical protein